MSTERVVNRTPETFGQQLERERLEAETKVIDQVAGHTEDDSVVGHAISGHPVVGHSELQNAAHTSTSIWNPVGTPVWNSGVKPVTAEAQRAGEIGKIEEPLVRDSVAADILFAELVQAAQGRAPRDPDLKEFRRQVIAAFKHMGLDTVKHFGV